MRREQQTEKPSEGVRRALIGIVEACSREFPTLEDARTAKAAFSSMETPLEEILRKEIQKEECAFKDLRKAHRGTRFVDGIYHKKTLNGLEAFRLMNEQGKTPRDLKRHLQSEGMAIGLDELIGHLVNARDLEEMPVQMRASVAQFLGVETKDISRNGRKVNRKRSHLNSQEPNLFFPHTGGEGKQYEGLSDEAWATTLCFEVLFAKDKNKKELFRGEAEQLDQLLRNNPDKALGFKKHVFKDALESKLLTADKRASGEGKSRQAEATNAGGKDGEEDSVLTEARNESRQDETMDKVHTNENGGLTEEGVNRKEAAISYVEKQKTSARPLRAACAEGLLSVYRESEDQFLPQKEVALRAAAQAGVAKTGVTKRTARKEATQLISEVGEVCK